VHAVVDDAADHGGGRRHVQDSGELGVSLADGHRPQGVAFQFELVGGQRLGQHRRLLQFAGEVFPVRVRTTSHGVAAAAGKLGAFAATYALTALLPAIGFGRTSAIAASRWLVCSSRSRPCPSPRVSAWKNSPNPGPRPEHDVSSLAPVPRQAAG
jgi:hypothetical protein